MEGLRVGGSLGHTVANFSGRFSSKKDGVAVEGWILKHICLSKISEAKQIQQPFVLKSFFFVLVNGILTPLPLLRLGESNILISLSSDAVDLKSLLGESLTNML